MEIFRAFLDCVGIVLLGLIVGHHPSDLPAAIADLRAASEAWARRPR